MKVINPRIRAVVVAFIVAVLLAPVHAVASGADGAIVVRPTTGLTRALHGRLAADWWEWAVSIPAPEHPLSQEGAVDCGAHQPTTVWFLGGVVNRPGTVERSCRVPLGKPLFFAVINVECSNREPDPFHGDTPAERRTCVNSFRFSDITATVDGMPVTGIAEDRVTSPPFTIRVPADNILAIPGPVSARATASGVHLLIPYLRAGSHDVHFTGTFTDFGFTLDITYRLTVGPA